MGHIYGPVFMIISIWNQWPGNKRFWWRKNLPLICEEKDMRFGLIKPHLPSSHHHHRRPVFCLRESLWSPCLRGIFLPWRHKSAQGNTEIVVKDLCPPEVLPRRECNGENCLRRPLGQSKSFRRVLCAGFVCFVTMTPCFSRALRFPVAKNTTEAQRSRRFTENTQRTKRHEVHNDQLPCRHGSYRHEPSRETCCWSLEVTIYLLDQGIKAMGCRNSPLTIKPYPMKIQAEYR